MFKLTNEQIDEINRFKIILQEPKLLEWYENEKQFTIDLNIFLKKKRFSKGYDLKLEDFYYISQKIVDLFGNTQLSIRGERSVFESNDIITFNNSLRNLYYGKSSLVERVEEFLNNKRVGITTMSQLLLVKNHQEYPYFSNFMRDVFEWLNIDSDQYKEIEAQAKKEFNISKNIFSKNTEEYFNSFIILREIKEEIKLESYYLVQNLLWNIYSQIEYDDEDEDENDYDEITGSTGLPFGSESTLRDYLALNPHLIEKNMYLVQIEYPTIVGPIDLLCKDKDNKFVIIELKKTKDSDKAVGKILRYMGAIKEEKNEEPRGILIMYEKDTRINYALKVVNNVQLKYYKINFAIYENPIN